MARTKRSHEVVADSDPPEPPVTRQRVRPMAPIVRASDDPRVAHFYVAGTIATGRGACHPRLFTEACALQLNPVNNRAAFMPYCLDAGLQRFTWISTVWSNRHGVKQADAFTQTE